MELVETNATARVRECGDWDQMNDTAFEEDRRI
jgi:hypothetical protein